MMRWVAVAFVILGAALSWVIGRGETRVPAEPVHSKTAGAPIPPTMPAVATGVEPQTDQETAPREELRSFLRREAMNVGRADSQPQQTLQRLRDRALELRPAELLWLKDTATNRNADGDERFLSVYLLGLAPDPRALDHLRALGRSAVPRTANEREYTDEIVLRAFALDAIVKTLPPPESAAYLRELLIHCDDPAIARHARYWLARIS